MFCSSVRGLRHICFTWFYPIHELMRIHCILHQARIMKCKVHISIKSKKPELLLYRSFYSGSQDLVYFIHIFIRCILKQIDLSLPIFNITCSFKSQFELHFLILITYVGQNCANYVVYETILSNYHFTRKYNVKREEGERGGISLLMFARCMLLRITLMFKPLKMIV